MELYLVRHAVAEARDAEQWPDDGLRPLTADGEAKFRKAARGLHRLAPTVDAVVASPFTRAWRTAELLQEEAGWPVQIIAVRYSRAHLLSLLESLDTIALPGDAWVGLGWDAHLNAVTAQLRRWGERKIEREDIHILDLN